MQVSVWAVMRLLGAELIGAKPLKVCHWILDLLNFKAGDELVDLYPGTNIMSMAVGQRRLLGNQAALDLGRMAKSPDDHLGARGGE